MESIVQPGGISAVMQHGEYLHGLRVVPNAIPELVGEDVQAHSACAAVDDRRRVREVGEAAGGGEELLDEATGLFRRLRVVVGLRLVEVALGVGAGRWR